MLLILAALVLALVVIGLLLENAALSRHCDKLQRRLERLERRRRRVGYSRPFQRRALEASLFGRGN